MGPFPSPDGVEALGTGLLPAQLKSQHGPGSFKDEKAVWVFLQPPLMTGNAPPEASVPELGKRALWLPPEEKAWCQSGEHSSPETP